LKGDLKNALADFNVATSHDHENPSAYINRASVYDQQGNRKTAIADLKRALACKPSKDKFVDVESDFDDDTRAVIRRWQAARGYPSTGFLNKLQHKALLSEIVATVENDSSGDSDEHPSRRHRGGGEVHHYAHYHGGGGGPGGLIGGMIGGLFGRR
jgi:tetratricopeptide (TPR) repeat protein